MSLRELCLMTMIETKDIVFNNTKEQLEEFLQDNG